MSIVFDRATSYYDRTRGLPPEAEIGLAEVLREHTALGPGSRVLELGVGTGRIALPLMRHNRYHYTGVDLSAEMMQVLRGKLGDLRIALLRADVARLPLRSQQFAAVVAVHVFHLVGEWSQAMDEVRRVLRPGGLLLHGYNHHRESSPVAELRNKLTELSEPSSALVSTSMLAWPQIEAELAQRFGSSRECATASWTVHTTARALIGQFQSRIWSQTWSLSDEQLSEAARQASDWAAQRFGGLDAPLAGEQQFRWKMYTKHG